MQYCIRLKAKRRLCFQFDISLKKIDIKSLLSGE